MPGKEAKARAKVPTRNVTIDADCQEALVVRQGELEEKFGFRPTLSQTIRHLLKQPVV